MSDTPMSDALYCDVNVLGDDRLILMWHLSRKLEREAAAWQQWLRDHLTSHYAARAAAGEIPAAQVEILTDIAMNQARALLAQREK